MKETMFIFGKFYLITHAKQRQNLKLKKVDPAQTYVYVKETENYPVDNPSDYWRISIYLVFLDHLVEQISKRIVSNEERFFGIFSKPSKSQIPVHLTPEINDRLFNVYQKDFPRKVDFVDVIGKPGRLLQMISQRDYLTLYMQQTLTYTRLYTFVHHHQYLTDNVGVIDNKGEIFQCNETHGILLKVDYGR